MSNTPSPHTLAAGRVLGVDVGTVRIGLALSDVERMVATPLQTVQGRDQQAAIDAICEVIQTHDVQALIVGLPLDLDGREGRAAKRTRRFVRRLEARATLPVFWLDERLTSAQATRTLIQADVGRAQRKKVIDQVAASLILQSWLDAQPRTID